MKSGIIQSILRNIDKQAGFRLVDEDENDFELECENGMCKVYRIDEDGESFELTEDEIENIYLPFVFGCINVIVWNEI